MKDKIVVKLITPRKVFNDENKLLFLVNTTILKKDKFDKNKHVFLYDTLSIYNHFMQTKNNSYPEMAKIFNISEKSIRNIINNIMKDNNENII